MHNELIEASHENIKNLIYTIRNRQVILDSDVAILYECETKYVNRAMKRNEKRFPDEDFCFQLTDTEYKSLRCQNGTLKKNEQEVINNTLSNEVSRGKHRKYLPYVFTEQGISMLSPLLNSKIAIQVSINIIRAFVDMRKIINTNRDLFERIITIENKIDQKFIRYDTKFEQIFNAIEQSLNKFKH